MAVTAISVLSFSFFSMDLKYYCSQMGGISFVLLESVFMRAYWCFRFRLGLRLWCLLGTVASYWLEEEASCEVAAARRHDGEMMTFSSSPRKRVGTMSPNADRTTMSIQAVNE